MDMMNRSSAFYMGRIIAFYAVSGFGSLAFFVYIFTDFGSAGRINGEYSLH